MTEGESVSPPCATMTWRPSAAARARSAFTIAARRAKPPRALAVGKRLLAHQVEIVEQDERDVRRVRPPAPRRGASRRARAWRRMRRGRSGGSAWFWCSHLPPLTMRIIGTATPISRELCCDERSLMSTSAAGRPADHPPVASGRIGVLLVNLGTPDATDYWSMRRYLKEFLSDRPRDRGEPAEVVAGAQSDHPDDPSGPQGARLRQDLEPRARRIAAEDHHARAGREAGRRCWRPWTAASPSTGRCATAIRRLPRGSTRCRARAASAS